MAGLRKGNWLCRKVPTATEIGNDCFNKGKGHLTKIMNNYYIKDTEYGFGVFSWGKLIIEFASYDEAREYIENGV